MAIDEDLFRLDTPVQKLDLPSARLAELSLYIKRDDLIHPFVSGNKWRKLKYNLELAQREGKKRITTFGGAYSNHLIATAVATAAAGFSSRGFVRGEELNAHSNYILRLCFEYGMELKFLSRSDYANKHILSAELTRLGDYVIPEGGNNDEGIRGCEEILPTDNYFNHVAVAVGTGTTMRGLMRGAHPGTTVHGFAAFQQAGMLLPSLQPEAGKIELHTDYAYGGFGKFDEEQLAYNRNFAKSTGILIDPVYTGKMFRGLEQLISQNYFTPGDTILCIHTGGMTGILSEQWLQTKF